jgi:hypothetical protein
VHSKFGVHAFPTDIQVLSDIEVLEIALFLFSRYQTLENEKTDFNN